MVIIRNYEDACAVARQGTRCIDVPGIDGNTIISLDKI